MGLGANISTYIGAALDILGGDYTIFDFIENVRKK